MLKKKSLLMEHIIPLKNSCLSTCSCMENKPNGPFKRRTACSLSLMWSADINLLESMKFNTGHSMPPELQSYLYFGYIFNRLTFLFKNAMQSNEFT